MSSVIVIDVFLFEAHVEAVVDRFVIRDEHKVRVDSMSLEK